MLELPAPAVKAVVNLAVSTVHVLGERTARRGIESILATLLKFHGVVAVKYLAAACTNVFLSIKSCTRATTAHVSLFRWTCLALKVGGLEDSNDWIILVCIVSSTLELYFSS